MGRMDIFCSSPASTAICSGTDQLSMVRRSHRPSNRHVHHYHDHQFRRKDEQQQPKHSTNPSTSRKSTSSSSSSAAKQSSDSRRTSSVEVQDLTRMIRPRPRPQPQPRDSDSSRYLLSNNNSTTTTSSHFVDWLSDEEHKSKLPPIRVRHHDSPKLIDSSSSSSRSGRDQVVVLKVSLHCKGCEAKVRKHISKMEGVTSFSTDLETKKVAVMGNVTPSGVLASVSRVKNAQLWPLS